MASLLKLGTVVNLDSAQFGVETGCKGLARDPVRRADVQDGRLGREQADRHGPSRATCRFGPLTRETSAGLKSRAPRWPPARYGRACGGRLRASLADDERALRRRAGAPRRARRRGGRGDGRQWAPRLRRGRVPEIPPLRGAVPWSPSTPTTAASTSMPPCTSPRETVSGSIGSASTSAVRRSGRAACTGCATGGSPSPCSARGRTGRPISVFTPLELLERLEDGEALPAARASPRTDSPSE